jgi:hypothetical protein
MYLAVKFKKVPISSLVTSAIAGTLGIIQSVIPFIELVMGYINGSHELIIL